MKRFHARFLFATAALCVAGCTSVSTFDYEGARGTMIRAVSNGFGGAKSVAVMPFMDQRGAYAGDHRYNDRGSYWLGWIPFVPSGYEVKNSPEKSDGFIEFPSTCMGSAMNALTQSAATTAIIMHMIHPWALSLRALFSLYRFSDLLV